MATKGKQAADRNTEPSPMTYEVTHYPSFIQMRNRLAAEADGMTMEELKSAAVEAQIDTGDAKTKSDLVSAVKDGARTVVPAESTPIKG